MQFDERRDSDEGLRDMRDSDEGLHDMREGDEGLRDMHDSAPIQADARQPDNGAAFQADAGQPVDRAVPVNGNGAGEQAVDLFDGAELQRFRADWSEVQNRFVDDPQAAVQDADRLVAEVMQTLASTFADRKQELEAEWQHGSTGETEDLRQALRHYRSYFNRLLST